MVRITITPDFRSQLEGYKSPLEVCDEHGRVLGHFFPAQDPADYEGDHPLISQEEFDRRIAEESERPLRDILRDLEQRS